MQNISWFNKIRKTKLTITNSKKLPWNEINKSDKKAKQPKSAQVARAHDLPKTHKHYERLPKFRPVVNTINTPYYDISKIYQNYSIH